MAYIEVPEIKALIQQKREIEERIKLLKNRTIKFGNVSVYLSPAGYWKLAIKAMNGRYCNLISCATATEMSNNIGLLIDWLQKAFDEIEERGESV